MELVENTYPELTPRFGATRFIVIVYLFKHLWAFWFVKYAVIDLQTYVFY